MTVRQFIQSFLFDAYEDISVNDVCIQVGEHYIPLKGWELVRVQKDDAGVYFPADKYDNIGNNPVSVVVVRSNTDGKE
jgi:hypothetical protein